MSYDEGLIEFIVDTLYDAAPRYAEPPVRTAYDALMASMEAQGDGSFYEAEPLTAMQLSLLRVGLRGADDIMPIVSTAIELGAVLAQTTPSIITPAKPAETPPIPAKAVTAYTPPPVFAAPTVEAGVAPQAQTAPSPQSPAMPAGVNISQHIGSASNSSITMIGVSHADPMAEPLPWIHDSAGLASPPASAEAAPPAPEPEHYDVFLSYSRRDGAIMRRLLKDLRRAGVMVWTDEHLAPGTNSWVQAIESALRASSVLIVLLTPNSKASSFVEKEILTAQAHRIPVIPLLAVGDEKSAVPILLQNVQWGDIRSEALYRKNTVKLIQRLRTLRKKSY
jgi:hypothetical protein